MMGNRASYPSGRPSQYSKIGMLLSLSDSRPVVCTRNNFCFRQSLRGIVEIARKAGQCIPVALAGVVIVFSPDDATRGYRIAVTAVGVVLLLLARLAQKELLRESIATRCRAHSQNVIP
jgi:hypothetical protein